MAHPPNWCNAVYCFRRFFPSSDSRRLEKWKGGLLMFSSSFSWHYILPILSQSLVCTLFKFKITEVRCQLHYTSAKILIKSPGMAHPFCCFQNDHAVNVRDKLLLARNTQYVYCKSIAYEIWLHQHLHTMCCQEKNPLYPQFLLMCSSVVFLVLGEHFCASCSCLQGLEHLVKCVAVVRFRAGAVWDPPLCACFFLPL